MVKINFFQSSSLMSTAVRGEKRETVLFSFGFSQKMFLFSAIVLIFGLFCFFFFMDIQH